MSPALIYWVVIAAIGFIAAIGSLIAGLSYYGYLKTHRPELARSYWPEMVRDCLLVVGLALNLLVGALAADPRAPAAKVLGLIGILGGATALSLFASFNFVLRVRR